jgi:hypothetical protein
MMRRRGNLYITGAMILLLPPLVWVGSSVPAARTDTPATPVAVAERTGVELVAHAVGAVHDPAALIRESLERYEREVDDYSFVLLKQELLSGKLTPIQSVEVRFRDDPRAIYMLWKENADQAKRALYIDSSEYMDKKGRKLIRVEPAGAIARLFVKDTFVKMHGAEAKKSSRRTIDECGFGATLDLLKRYNTLADKNGDLNLRYSGTGVVDGRPTHVITRDLPYTGPEGTYPDARLVLHLDQQWMLPVAMYSYADHQQRDLLGSYVFTQIDLDPDFDESSFNF